MNAAAAIEWTWNGFCDSVFGKGFLTEKSGHSKQWCPEACVESTLSGYHDRHAAEGRVLWLISRSLKGSRYTMVAEAWVI